MVPPASPFRRALQVGFISVAAMAALLLTVCAYSLVYPVTANGVERFSSGKQRAFDMPLMDLLIESGHLRGSFDMFVPSRWSPLVFMRYFRNRTPMDTLTVNGVGVAFHRDQFIMDLSSVLHLGWNHFEFSMHMEDDIPSFIFGLEPSRQNAVPWIYFFACLTIILVWYRLLLRILFPSGFPRPIGLVLLGGVVLRTAYTFALPYYIHAHDVSGHVAYLQHVATHWTVPLTFSSWQAHQAPLYYFFAAPFYAVAERFVSPALALVYVQQLSLLLAVGMLLTGVGILRFVFGTDRVRMLLGVAFLSVFPGLIFLTSQINNDVLVTFLGFLWFLQILRAVKSRRLWDWGIVGLIIGFGIVTKGNALLWLPVTALSAVAGMDTWKRRFSSVVLSTLLAVVVASPLLLWRHRADPNYGLVANAQLLQGSKLLQPSVRELFSFNPIEVLLHRQMLGADAGARSQNFPEAVFLTSQFGYADFGQEASVLLVFGMLLFPLVFLGGFKMMRRGDSVPVIILGSLLFCLLLFRLKSPYLPSQNFRYIVVAVLPLSILVAEGAVFFRPLLIRAFTQMSVILYLLSAAVFFFGIVMGT
ncbi:MAG: glycosyltransferase family 39 protein [Candidatus Peribacteraceae bacterium]|nr:glycosyltransferase family 39 protein [Candidatus Peribacteraceae bacterium]